MKLLQKVNLVFFSFLSILGLFSYINLPVELLPNFEDRRIIISVQTDQSSPKESVENVVGKISSSLKKIPDIVSFAANAEYNHTLVEIDIKEKSDINYITSEIEKNIKELNLKEKIFVTPTKLKLNELLPALSIGISNNKINDEKELFTFADQLRSQIESKKEIGKVKIVNPSKEQISIVLDPSKMQKNMVTFGQIYDAFKQKKMITNKIGTVHDDNNQLNVIINNQFQNIEEISNLPIINVLDKTIKLSEIATIEKSIKEPENLIRLNGESAIILEIYKQQNGNLLDVSNFVRKIINTIEKPKNIEVSIMHDSVVPAQKRIDDIVTSLFISGLIVSSIVLFFLGVQSSITIMISMISTFLILCLILNIIGITLNLFVMYSILISLGVIIDNSIVVTEEAQKNIAKGNSVEESYDLAIKSTFLPLASSLITTLIAFGTLFFMPGKIGKAIHFLPLTMSITLITSFCVTIFFNKLLGQIFINPKKVKSINSEQHYYYYQKILEFFIHRPKLVAAQILMTLLLIPTIIFYLHKNDNLVFTSDIEPNKIIVEFRNNDNFSTEKKLQIIKEAENKLSIYSDNFSNIESIILNEKNNIGKIILHLAQGKTNINSNKLADKITNTLKDQIPSNINFNVLREKYLSSANLSNNYDMNVELSSHNYELLSEKTKSLLNYIQNNMDYVKTLYSDIESNNSEQINLKINQDAVAKYKANTDLIVSEIALLTNNINLGKYANEIDIIAKYNNEKSVDKFLEERTILTKNGYIPLKNFIIKETMPSIVSASSKNSEFIFTLFINTDKIYKVKKEVINWCKTNCKDINISFGKIEVEEKEIYSFFGKAIILSSIAMLAILYLQFKDLTKAFIAISSLIFILLGILIRSIIIQNPFNILINSIGIMFLMGVAINNNIIIIDKYIQIRDSGAEPIKAAIESCKQRFLPIILTSITTILSMLIPALNLNINISKMNIEYGSAAIAWAHDMSSGIIFGMTISTIASLFILPVVIAYADILLNQKNNKK